MANSKKKNFWYVLVFTDEGPKYVTGRGEHHTAYWKSEDKPMEMSKEWAQDMVKGLTWNGFTAVPVCSEWEIENHPYRYTDYHIEWKENDKEVE